MTFLYDSYLVFWEFGSNFDMLLNDSSAKIQYRQFLNITNTDYQDAVRINVQNNLLQLTGLYANLDYSNAECKTSGVIFGALSRKIFSF